VSIKIETLDKQYYEIDDEINRPDPFVPQHLSDREKIEQYERLNPGKIKSLQDQYNRLLEEKEKIVKRIQSLDKELTEKQREELYKK
jgi:chromosome segregation ATPase